jgi:hypothetical protein
MGLLLKFLNAKTIIKYWMSLRCSSVIEYMSSTLRALGSVSSTAKIKIYEWERRL